MGCIYVAWFPSGKGYCGQCLDFKSRRRGHLNAARRGSRLRFHQAIRKYGQQNVEWSIEYDDVPVAELDRLEKGTIAWFGFFGSGGYNSKPGGLSARGWHHSVETKKKQSMSMGGKPKSPEHCARISEANKGKTKGKPKHPGFGKKLSESIMGHLVSQKTRELISVSLIGRKHPPEFGQRISKALKGKAKPLGFGRNRKRGSDGRFRNKQTEAMG